MYHNNSEFENTQVEKYITAVAQSPRLGRGLGDLVRRLRLAYVTAISIRYSSAKIIASPKSIPALSNRLYCRPYLKWMYFTTLPVQVYILALGVIRIRWIKSTFKACLATTIEIPN